MVQGFRPSGTSLVGVASASCWTAPLVRCEGRIRLLPASSTKWGAAASLEVVDCLLDAVPNGMRRTELGLDGHDCLEVYRRWTETNWPASRPCISWSVLPAGGARGRVQMKQIGR